MNNKIFSIFWVCLFVIISITSALPSKVFAIEKFNESLSETSAESGYSSTGNPKTDQAQIYKTIASVIQVLLSLLGIIFIVLIIYAGFIWMLARGNEQEVEKAKKIIQNSMIGLVIVLSAYAITSFVGRTLTL